MTGATILRTPKTARGEREPTVHADVAEGRGVSLDRSNAERIARASERAGFPVPPHIAQALKAPRSSAGSKPAADPQPGPGAQAEPGA